MKKETESAIDKKALAGMQYGRMIYEKVRSGFFRIQDLSPHDYYAMQYYKHNKP